MQIHSVSEATKKRNDNTCIFTRNLTIMQKQTALSVLDSNKQFNHYQSAEKMQNVKSWLERKTK